MNQFEKAIKAYLDDRASQDDQFAQSYKKENKSIEECCRFIIEEAKKRMKGNVSVMSDDETYGLAVHYYDEDSIVVKGGGAGVRVSKDVEYTPTEEDKEAARKAALRRLEEEAYNKLRAPKRKNNQQEDQQVKQPTLFDLI